MTQARTDRAGAVMLALSILLTGFVIVAVNLLIYRARAVFAVRNPDFVAQEPATISESISDPLIGEPFAMWMAICAPILFVGVALLVYSGWRFLQLGGGATSASDQKAIATYSLLLVLFQAAACVGMVMLSRYRFPENGELHMQGSYLFFFSQAFVIVTGEVLSRRLLAQPEDRSLVFPKAAAFRNRYVWVPIVLGVVYLSFFVIKNFELGDYRRLLYVGYTTTEPLLISSFLGYILSFHADMAVALRRYFWA